MDSLRVLADLFAMYPISFTLVTILVVTLVYFKRVWVGKSTEASLKNAYAGWKVEATVDAADRFVMRPVKMRSVAIWTFLFFGAGAAFYAFAVLPEGNAQAKDIFAFAIMCVFALLAVWLFLRSFAEIIFDGEVFVRSGAFERTATYPLQDLQSLRPLSKTLKGGITLDFGNRGLLKVPANMSGYRQLLEFLSRNDPKFRMIVAAYSKAAEQQL